MVGTLDVAELQVTEDLKEVSCSSLTLKCRRKQIGSSSDLCIFVGDQIKANVLVGLLEGVDDMEEEERFAAVHHGQHRPRPLVEQVQVNLTQRHRREHF